MAQQESVRAPGPSDADPHGLSNVSGSRSSQSQHPLDDSEIEAQPLSTAAAEAEPAAAEAEPAAPEAQPAVAQAQTAALQLHSIPTETTLLYSYRRLYHAAKNGDWKTAESFVWDNRNFAEGFVRDNSNFAEGFLGDKGNLWLARLTGVTADTVMMVAARSFKWEFVEKLAELLTPKQLAMQNSVGYTVLHFVAYSERVKTAEILVRKCSELTQTRAMDGATPLLLSVRRSLHKDMIWYLALVTRLEPDSSTCPFTGNLSKELFHYLTYSGFHDIATYLLRRYHEHVKDPIELAEDLLCWLSALPSNLHINKNSLTFIERWLYKFIHVEIGVPPHSLRNRDGVPASAFPVPSRSFLCRGLHCLKMLLWKASEKLVPGLKRVREAKLQHRCVEQIVEKFYIEFGLNLSFDRAISILVPVIFSATSLGHVEIVRICLKHFPDLIFRRNGQGENLLHVATESRQEEIFNLITEIPATGDYLANLNDEEGKTVWHRSAKLAPSSKLLLVSGAALQMQRELQWFKEVEKLIDPANKCQTNEEDKTATVVFMENHKNLAEEGEKWMKGTANACMIVATLIATVVFAAAFTVPGGNIGDTGIPVFLQRTDFLVFAISDALALLSSSTSLLMFLSILTARYAPEDFLLRLPKRLIIGLGSLFFAIITMMVAFGAALYMLVKDRWQSVYIPIIALSSIPALTFVKLQLPLFYDMVLSTYGPGVFKKKKT